MTPFGVRWHWASKPMIRICLLATFIAIAGFFGPAIQASNYVVTEYATIQDAVAESFGGAADLSTQTLKIDADMRKQIEQQLGSRWPVSTVEYKVVSKQGKPVGLAFVFDEIGKHYPITFCVMLGAKNEIRDVSVLTYREPIGADIRKNRFKKQFSQKTTADISRLDDTIIPITGSTLSSWAAVTVAKKALILGEMIR